MTRPLILDLCCKAGGAAKGYHDAGFDVIGVDLERQKNFPFPIIVGDALALDRHLLRRLGVAAIHASPDCQGYTIMRHAKGAKGKPRTIPQFRKVLKATGLPYVIENVVEAGWDMIDPIKLCGSMFGLGAQGHQLQRERLFETNFPASAPGPCIHTQPVIGVYGGHARNRSAAHGGRGTKDVWEGGHKVAASQALGIDWMTLEELSNAIPPAFTQHVGLQLLAHLRASGRIAA
jgi:DNA (cytosine-5)-methyltransferase 1